MGMGVLFTSCEPQTEQREKDAVLGVQELLSLLSSSHDVSCCAPASRHGGLKALPHAVCVGYSGHSGVFYVILITTLTK